MRKPSARLAAAFVGLAILLQACASGGGANAPVRQQMIKDRTLAHGMSDMNDKHAGMHGKALDDAAVIPGAGQLKTRTTNERGSTVTGMGASVYSLIGSSGLHSRGMSSHLESRLGGEGLTGIKAFAMDDVVYLASAERNRASSDIDPLQQKLLSPTGGLSGNGPGAKGSLAGKTNARSADEDDMAKAKRWVQQNLGDSVTVHTLTGERAVAAIGRIRALSSDGSSSPSELAGEIRKLLDLAKAQGQ